MADTLVLGLGNTLRGDDGIGPAVIAALQAEQNLPPDVDLVDGGTPGLEIVLLLDGYRRAVIVDAANMGCAPGEWRRLTAEPLLFADDPAEFRGTLHNAGLVEALHLAHALGTAPAEIVVYGIQPQNVGWNTGLSAAVRAAVPAVQRAVIDELTG